MNAGELMDPADIIEQYERNRSFYRNGGITVTGGGSLVRGIDKLIEANTNIKTRVAEEPETCAANGAGKALEWLNDMQEGTINLARRKQMM